MRTFMNTFLKGLLAFLPIFLTLYCAYYVASWLNEVSNHTLRWFAPELPTVPGIGIVVGIVAIFALGVLITSRLTRWIFKLIESPLLHLPIVKDLYAALKQLMMLVAPQQGDSMGKVVSVKHPAQAVTMVGLVMRNDADVLSNTDASDDLIAVYFPMSYQIGGYTLFVPRLWVTVMDMTVEEAMGKAVTGWMSQEERK